MWCYWFSSLRCFINTVQFNSALNLACRLKREASHPASDGSLGGAKKKATTLQPQILLVRESVPVLLSDSQQLSGGSPVGWSLGGLAQLALGSRSTAGSVLTGASGCGLRCWISVTSFWTSQGFVVGPGSACWVLDCIWYSALTLKRWPWSALNRSLTAHRDSFFTEWLLFHWILHCIFVKKSPVGELCTFFSYFCSVPIFLDPQVSHLHS